LKVIRLIENTIRKIPKYLQCVPAWAVVLCLFATSVADASGSDGKAAAAAEAIQPGLLAHVKEAVAAKRDINDRDEATGETFFTRAAYDNDRDAAAYLLDHGANMNAVNANDLTPLMCAALMGRVKIVGDLLDRGAYVNMRDRNGYTALMLAVFRPGKGEWKTFRGSDKTESDVVSVVKQLIKRGADLSAKNRVNDSHTAMAVHIAEGAYPEAQALIEKAMFEGPDADPYGQRTIVNVWKKPPESASPLVYKRITTGNEAAVRDLLKKGADINDMDDAGNSALMRAAVLGYPEMVRLLLEHKPDPDLPSWVDGMTALMLALKHGHLEIADILVSHGADINAKDRSGQTALMRSVKDGNADAEQWLKKNKATDPLTR